MPNVMSKIMTLEEQATKEDIMERLGEQGYPTYAHLFDKFALHLTADPNVIGYMVPDKGIIVLNRYLSLNQVSTIVRHEILHQYLEHGRRELSKLGVNSFDEINDASLHELSNIAADFEISNKGYTDKDKRIARAIRLNGEVLKGLVTEDEHKDWIDLTYEEMFDKLIEERKKNGSESNQAKQQAKIGSQGDEEMQKAEAAERAAQIAKEQAEEAINSASSPQEKQDAQKQANDAKEAENKAKQIQDKLSSASGQESDSDEKRDSSKGTGRDGAFSDYTLTPQDLEDIKNAISEIKDLLKNKQVGDKVKKDNENAKRKEVADRKEKAEKEYRNNPLTKFVSSLNGFIEKEVEYIRDKTWKKINPTYASSGIMRQGVASSVMRTVPLVQVYYDRSGSWDGDAKKEEVGKRGIDSLNKYVKEGLLKVEKYYFDTKISTSSDNMGGGTLGTPILNNIKNTKPDNVIIITDSDIADCNEDIQVPGAVWFLFVNGVSDNLKNHLHGKRLTKSFEIDMR